MANKIWQMTTASQTWITPGTEPKNETNFGKQTRNDLRRVGHHQNNKKRRHFWETNKTKPRRTQGTHVRTYKKQLTNCGQKCCKHMQLGDKRTAKKTNDNNFPTLGSCGRYECWQQWWAHRKRPYCIDDVIKCVSNFVDPGLACFSEIFHCLHELRRIFSNKTFVTPLFAIQMWKWTI